MYRIRLTILIVLLLVLGAGFGITRFAPHILPGRMAEPLGLRRDITEVRAAVTAPLTHAMHKKGLEFGAPVFLRIFKEEAELELWVQAGDTFRLFKTYPICNHSGDLGPKLREGDRQSPEGFYKVGLGALNPNSSYHLSFNLGFPNAYDRANGRTGSYLMVHGDCLSIGCYAMTDPAIEEIYVLVEAALNQGQGSFDVHAFPFRMSADRMAQAQGHRWYDYWADMQPVFEAFETTRQVPQVALDDSRYVLADG